MLTCKSICRVEKWIVIFLSILWVDNLWWPNIRIKHCFYGGCSLQSFSFLQFFYCIISLSFRSCLPFRNVIPQKKHLLKYRTRSISNSTLPVLQKVFYSIFSCTDNLMRSKTHLCDAILTLLSDSRDIQVFYFVEKYQFFLQCTWVVIVLINHNYNHQFFL